MKNQFQNLKEKEKRDLLNLLQEKEDFLMERFVNGKLVQYISK